MFVYAAAHEPVAVRPGACGSFRSIYCIPALTVQAAEWLSAAVCWPPPSPPTMPTGALKRTVPAAPIGRLNANATPVCVWVIAKISVAFVFRSYPSSDLRKTSPALKMTAMIVVAAFPPDELYVTTCRSTLSQQLRAAVALPLLE